jgi:SynChlorMet cassette protein ScmC
MTNLLMYNYPKGYNLYLEDGTNYWLTGYDDSIEFVDEFASIMRLTECPPNLLPKIIFYKTKIDYQSTNDNNSILNEYTQSLDKNEWEIHHYYDLSFCYNTISSDILCEIKIDKNGKDRKYQTMWTSLQAIYFNSINRGGLPIHGALIQHEGRGFLLAAEGETGKSTCCRRLPDYWQALCDDESLIVLNKNSKYRVHPFPTWSDYLSKRAKNTWNVQNSVPLSAIFFIEQSETDEVISLPVTQASLLVTDSAVQSMASKQTEIDKTDQSTIMTKIFNNSFDIATNIPAFRLKVSLRGTFWKEIEKVMR